ncbi:PREDICTED: uncharacterized protein LOC109171283 [Ipomoea nil]|uniref:uncharacterized protein LOC109171283 n=1 Tax=Ipomoea nil TaxID=35883 RepID=UPI00090138CD|nr:PREDICTED: uncharacterized protein LOC109171283 [Ipomoea nil]
MSLKSENHITEKCFNQIIELMKEVVPEDNLVPDNFCETKRLLQGMGLPVQKIDCSKNNYHKLKKKNGIFIDERSKKITEEIQARHDAAMQEAKESTEPPIINMPQLSVDVVGGVKKQRIDGLGTKASSFTNENSCSSSATSPLNQDAMKEMVTQHLETMRAKMQAKMQAQLKAHMEAKLQAERAHMEAKLQVERTQMQTQIQSQITSLMDELCRGGMLIDELLCNGMLPTSMPRPPTTQAEHFANSNAKNVGDD